MKNKLWIVLLALALLFCKQRKSDEEYDKQSATSKKETENIMGFINQTLGHLSVMEEKNECNSKVVHLLADKIN